MSFTLQRTNIMSGKQNTMVIPMDEPMFEECFIKYEAGAYIQDAFYMLDPDIREFIKTGITPEEWDAIF